MPQDLPPKGPNYHVSWELNGRRMRMRWVKGGGGERGGGRNFHSGFVYSLAYSSGLEKVCLLPQFCMGRLFL